MLLLFCTMTELNVSYIKFKTEILWWQVLTNNVYLPLFKPQRMQLDTFIFRGFCAKQNESCGVVWSTWWNVKERLSFLAENHLLHYKRGREIPWYILRIGYGIVFYLNYCLYLHTSKLSDPAWCIFTVMMWYKQAQAPLMDSIVLGNICSLYLHNCLEHHL